MRNSARKRRLERGGMQRRGRVMKKGRAIQRAAYVMRMDRSGNLPIPKKVEENFGQEFVGLGPGLGRETRLGPALGIGSFQVQAVGPVND
jgi:hypothetical protein